MCSLHRNSSTYKLLARFNVTFASRIFWCLCACATTKSTLNYSCISWFIFHFSTKLLRAWKLNHDDGITVSFLGEVQCMNAMLKFTCPNTRITGCSLFMCTLRSIIVAQWHSIQYIPVTFQSDDVAKHNLASFLLLSFYYNASLAFSVRLFRKRREKKLCLSTKW